MKDKKDTSTNHRIDPTLDLDVALSVQVIREVLRYLEKKAGHRPWVDFAELLPVSVRESA